MCVSDTGPLYDKKINLLTSDKLEMCIILLEQFNSVLTMPLPNKQVINPDSLFSIESIISQDDEVFLTNIMITESIIMDSIKELSANSAAGRWNSCFSIVKMRFRTHTIPFIYYRFIVRFQIGLNFLFITFTFLLHFLLSWTSSLSIQSSTISTSTLSNHVFLGHPTGLLPLTLYSIHFFTQSSSHVHTISVYHF